MAFGFQSRVLIDVGVSWISARRQSTTKRRRTLHQALLQAMCAAALWSLGLMWPSAWAAPEVLYGEYRLKAAFLYRLTQFIEWPESSGNAEDAAFSLCVLGSDPFGESLRELSSRKVGQRRIALLYPATVKEAQVCQLVYINEASRKTLTELGAALSDLPVLTVGGAPQFIDQGGAIGFVVEAGKLRMELNLDVLRRANLKPSAKLIEVAVRTLGSGRGRP